MSDPLSVQTDGVHNYAQIHSAVRSGLSTLDAADGSGVHNTHGVIASPVSTALTSVLSGRETTLGATTTSAGSIAELLQQAAAAYAAGDEEGGRRLRAAADALDGGAAPGTQAGTASDAAVGDAGTDVAGQLGQVMGQVGQQIGQLASSLTQPLAGLVQGLAQVPQQLMQAAQAGGLTDPNEAVGRWDARGTDRDDSDTHTDDDTDNNANTDDDKADAEDSENPEHAQPNTTGPESDGPRAGSDTSGRAPVAADPPAQPAATRPQVS